MTLLSDYEAQVADLLHDPNNVIWSTTQLDRYINEARRQLVMDTGCLRTLQLSYLTPGRESYVFGSVSGASILAGGSGYVNPVVTFTNAPGDTGSGVAATVTQSGGAVNAITFTSTGSGYTTAPTAVITDTGGGTGAQIAVGVISATTYDVLGVNVIWGAELYSLYWMAFSDFSAKVRFWTSVSYQSQPRAWAAYGNASVRVGPPPDQSYQFELDTVVLPTNLADYVTIDPIPLVVQDPVKFYAAYLAKNNNQAFGEAELFRSQYERRMVEVSNAYTRRIPNSYGA